MTPASFLDLLLYFFNGPAIGRIGERTEQILTTRLNSRCQLIYRVAHRLAEIVQFLFAHPPFEGFADISTEQPEFDVVLFVDHRVLTMCEPSISHRRREGTHPDHGEENGDGTKGGYEKAGRKSPKPYWDGRPSCCSAPRTGGPIWWREWTGEFATVAVDVEDGRLTDRLITRNPFAPLSSGGLWSHLQAAGSLTHNPTSPLV
jgi:hypothetical protein